VIPRGADLDHFCSASHKFCACTALLLLLLTRACAIDLILRQTLLSLEVAASGNILTTCSFGELADALKQPAVELKTKRKQSSTDRSRSKGSSWTALTPVGP
jgi:hypothetical protein